MPFNAKCPGCGSSGDPCGCSDLYSDKTSSNDVKYVGMNLPNTGIETCDSLTVAIQKINTAIALIQQEIGLTSTTTTTAAP